jgi:hypothetical protein
MELFEIVCDVADVLKKFDSEKPIHKSFKPGIGPFGEPQLIKIVSQRLNNLGKYRTETKRMPDLILNGDWFLEFKIVRPFGDNGEIAENWSVNMLHPYAGNTSLIGDAIKLMGQNGKIRKAVFLIGYEYQPPKISLDPLIISFELILTRVIHLRIGSREEAIRIDLVHPEHQVVRCLGWELYDWENYQETT